MSTLDQLRQARLDNRLREERIRSHRLAAAERVADRRRQLLETVSLDWVTPYADLLDRFRPNGDPIIGGPASAWQRRYGRDWPVFQTELELAILRAPSRLLCATSDDAAGLITGVGAYVVGAGYTYRAAKRRKESAIPPEVVTALQAVVDEVLERAEWAGGEQFGVEHECFWRSLEDGEFILVNHPQDDGWTEFRVREPEHLTQPPGESDYDWTFGVCADPDDTARPLSYWLQHGDTPADGEEYGPDRVTHFKRNGRRSQKRGRPDFSFQLYDKLSLAGKIRINLSEAAAQQAAIVGVRQHEQGGQAEVQAFVAADADYTQTDPLTGTQSPVRQARRGSWEDIPKGMNYVAGPGAGTAADKHLSILQECLRGAVQRWNGFEWLISANAGTNNLPVDLSAESPFVRRVLQEQGRYRGAFKKPVWAAVRHYVETVGLVALGRSWSWDELEREVDLVVEAPSPETRNKLEETQRAQIEIPMGWDSPQRYMQSQGRDPDQVDADNREWKDEHPDQQQQGQDGGGLFDSLGRRRPAPTPGDSDPLPGLAEAEAVAEAVGRALLEAGFTGTDRLGRKWVDGREVKKDDAGGSGGGKDGGDAPTVGHFADGLPEKVAAADPAAAKDPKLMARVKDLALTAAAKAYTHLVRLTPAMLGVMEGLGAVFDTPADMQKFGYNPTTSGPTHTADAAAGADPVRAHLGISTHLAATIASHVLARGLLYVKRKLAGGRLESEEGDAVAGLAEVLHGAFAALAAELGLPEPPEPAAIESHLRGLVG